MPLLSMACKLHNERPALITYSSLIIGATHAIIPNRCYTFHSSDTVSRSAVFCAIATTIERCKTEGVVDVFQVVKAMRIQKPGAVRTMVSSALHIIM